MIKHIFKTSLFASALVISVPPVTAQAGIPDSLRLNVVFPSDDTLNFERIRFAGSVLPGSKVWVQGQDTFVYPTGAFVGMVDLAPGMNEIVFIGLDSIGALSDTIRVLREPPLVAFPSVPTVVNHRLVSPADDVYLSAGDVLEVEFFGSPGGVATFSIDDISKNMRMVELPKRVRNGLNGWYKGTVMIPPVEDYKPKPVHFRFRGKDGQVLNFESNGKINLFSPFIPAVGVTCDTTNIVQLKPEGEIWIELPPDIRLQVIGERKGLKIVRLAENITGYISVKSILMLPPGTPIPQAAVGNISTIEDDEWVQVCVNLSERVPVKVNQFLAPSGLELVFFRAQMVRPWIVYPANDKTIRSMQWWQPSSDFFVLRIDLNQTQQWGYKVRYVGNQLWFSIRKNPVLSNIPNFLLYGLTITVDAGHGGESEGATSPTGLLEKNLNLTYANMVADLLERAGAHVVRTRTQDTTLTLQDRVKISEDAGSHIFLSLHHNSIVPTSDPLRPRGSSTFFAVPHSEALAKTLYDRLVGIGLNPFGRIISNYYVTRQTSMISILVEATFMSHPEDERLLLSEGFLFDLALATVEGVKDFVRPLASPAPPILETKIGLPAEPDTTQN